MAMAITGSGHKPDSRLPPESGSQHIRLGADHYRGVAGGPAVPPQLPQPVVEVAEALRA